ncbi:flagellar basal body rod protein FlgB [Desulfurivibrio dismutans]|uniref:flagellar basal body rod protein FlgB n=1 Tax=Desulfurivibrio dismutans TaxID=1398908 RepID=UPI0023DCD1E8|nr:flagellar basal body rod protein FlgB [Desulfurivibrio alkaliphilus]MDF1614660.1 flagellar basal body rod protein FlgB [Desulfurivibrio alkaliphilus]
MPINKLFGGTIEVMHHSLNLRNERQGMIQSNIANLETPGYKVQDFPFERVMERVVSGQGQMARTNPRHLAVDPVEAARAGQFREEERPVDLDEEMLKLSENQMMYQVATQLIAKKFEGLRHIIDEGAK